MSSRFNGLGGALLLGGLGCCGSVAAQPTPTVQPPQQTPANEKAGRIYDDLHAQEPSNADWFLLRGQTRRQAGQPVAAILDFTRAIRLDSTNARSWAGRGKAWTDLQKLDSALVDLNRALRLDSTYYQALIDRGIVRTLRLDRRGGLVDLNRAVALAPPTADAYLNRATGFYCLNQLGAALRDINTHLQHHPTDPLGYYNRGLIYLKREAYQRALQDMARAQQLAPHDLDAYLGQADVYGQSGQRQLALTYLTGLLGRGFDEGPIWLEHGNWQQQIGNLAEACADWQRASALGNAAATKKLAQHCAPQGWRKT